MINPDGFSADIVPGGSFMLSYVDNKGRGGPEKDLMFMAASETGISEQREIIDYIIKALDYYKTWGLKTSSTDTVGDD